MPKNLIAACIFCLLSMASRTQPAQPPLKLDFFTSIPKVIDGCEADYTYDTTSLKKKRYILITNMQELAIIKVKGREISLKRISEDQIAKKTTRTIYKGSGYTVILTTKEGKQIGYEDALDAGSLEIIFGQFKAKIAIHGHVGC